MTKWRAPDGRVFDESEIDSYVMMDYFSEEDFEDKLDEWYEPLDVGGHEIYASEIVKKLRPYLFSEMYEAELDYYAEDPEMLGFERVTESGNRRVSTPGAVKPSKCVKKKTTAMAKPKSGAKKTSSNQRKPRSRGGRR